MNILKSIFGSGNNTGRSRDGGLYIYVKPKMCNEILRIRINTANDLSRTDGDKGYFVRKVANGTRCPFPVEVMIYFDTRRNILDREIENGEFVTEDDYDSFMAEKAQSS